MELVRVLSFTLIAGIVVANPAQNPVVHNEHHHALDGDSVVSHLDAEVHFLVVKVAALEESVRSMKLTMNLQAQQIEALQNHTDYRCESGIIGQHTAPPPAWPLTQTVTFKSPFEHTPTVTYGLYLLDADSNANLRVVTEVSSITKTGFQIKMNKWADTVLYGGKVSWMACGN